MSRARHCSRTWRSSRPTRSTGLYQGTPLPERSWAHGNDLPDRITIYQRPIEEDCEDEDEIRAVIGETLIHEVGHYFGMSEEEIEEIEERYWRGETLTADEDE
jgi:predicted Zn-dependent protease with MMP-like domain